MDVIKGYLEVNDDVENETISVASLQNSPLVGNFLNHYIATTERSQTYRKILHVIVYYRTKYKIPHMRIA